MLPRRPQAIEEVGQASMMDLQAVLYASEEALRSQDPAKRLAEAKRRREQRLADTLGRSNRGVGARNAADAASESQEEEQREAALRRKAEIYERMARGEEVSERTSASALLGGLRAQIPDLRRGSATGRRCRAAASSSAADGRRTARVGECSPRGDAGGRACACVAF
jgi:hypothetical protein